jgi:hypothetical protein
VRANRLLNLLLDDAGTLIPRVVFPRKHSPLQASMYARMLAGSLPWGFFSREQGPSLCAFEERHPKIAAVGRFLSIGFFSRGYDFAGVRV